MKLNKEQINTKRTTRHGSHIVKSQRKLMKILQISVSDVSCKREQLVMLLASFSSKTIDTIRQYNEILKYWGKK